MHHGGYTLKHSRAAAALLALVLAGDSASLAADPIPDVPGWRLSWHDEFDGTAVDTQSWNALNLQNSQNNEKQYYLAEQASLADGKLRITATNQPVGNKQYRSARLESKQQFPIGRFEARIDLPTTQGMWPAFWLLPNNKQWPTGGEIDIMENKGSQPLKVSSAYHWQTNPGPCCSQHQYVFREFTAKQGDVDVNFHTGFHLYAVEWEATQLRFFVDNTLFYTVPEATNRPIFENPMNIILNLAVGGDFGGDPNASTVFPQYMDVDYVRVWQKQTGLSGDFNSDGVVDATDYVVWRESQGQSGIGLAADGSGNGTVDETDLAIWRSNFGASASGSALATSIPEPFTPALSAMALLRVLTLRSPRCAPAARLRF